MLRKNTDKVTDIIEILNAVDDNCKILLNLLEEYYKTIDNPSENDNIVWSGQTVDLNSSAGAALLEYTKDAISTMMSNISGIGTNSIQARKSIERKSSTV